MSSGWDIYLATRKKNDFFFNTYVMRPIAAYVVSAITPTRITPNQVTLVSQAVFVIGSALLIALPTYAGGLIAVAVLELSYCFDCVDGMLARHKKIASKTGHLFDFFTDESKALMLVGTMAVRLFLAGGFGFDARVWKAHDARFLLGGIVGVFVIASATSLTNFVRRPELSGREQSVEAHYETNAGAVPSSAVGRLAQLVFGVLRVLNHYPTHIVLVAALARFDVFFWVYVLINGVYLAKGWIGLLLRFGVRGE